MPVATGTPGRGPPSRVGSGRIRPCAGGDGPRKGAPDAGLPAVRCQTGGPDAPPAGERRFHPH
eukprot:2179860-Alexandrium_andersonii.AAC.1